MTVRQALKPGFDALCLTALRQELTRLLLGGLVQRVENRGNDIVLEIYASHARHRLMVHIGDDRTRIHISTSKLRPPVLTETPMLLHLRKHVRDSRLLAIEQPPNERILRLTFAQGAVQTRETCGLIIEAMGRRSNAIMVDEADTIIEALRRTPPSRSQRSVLPHQPYQQPPAQDRMSATGPNLHAALERAAAGQPPDAPLAPLLSQVLAGMSPVAAQESSWVATGIPRAQISDVTDWNLAAERIRGMFNQIEHGQWRARVVYQNDVPISVGPYSYGWIENDEDITISTLPTMSAAIESVFALDNASPRVSRGGQVLVQKIENLIATERRRLGSIEREQEQTTDTEHFQRWGEAILASLNEVPAGAATFEFNDESIPLDPTMSPLECAQVYFKQHHGARSTRDRTPLLVEESTQRIDYLEGLIAMAQANDTDSAIRAISRELSPPPSSAKKARPNPRRRASEPQPKRIVTPDGTVILVGTNGEMNDRLTFRIASPDDTWLHARGAPGAHVVIRNGGRPPSDQDLQLAADLASRNSRARLDSAVPVSYTLVKHVRKIRGAHPGLVRYVQERTITGHPLAEIPV